MAVNYDVEQGLSFRVSLVFPCPQPHKETSVLPPGRSVQPDGVHVCWGKRRNYASLSVIRGRRVEFQKLGLHWSSLHAWEVCACVCGVLLLERGLLS